MATTTRRRSISESAWRASFAGRIDRKVGLPTVTTITGTPNKVKGTQVTVSEGHPWRNNPNRGKSDIGGDFFTQKTEISEITSREVSSYYLNSSQEPVHGVYTGPLTAVDPTTVAFPPFQNSSNSQLDAYGTTAIARSSPTNPVSSLTTTLAELFREGLPHLVGADTWRDGALTARNAGSEYLNVQFGWRPLINDISSFAGGVVDADSLVRQYKAGIGKPTRRGWEFPVIESTVTTNLGTGQPYSGGFGVGTYWDGPGSRLGNISRTRVSYTRRWFRGAYTYYFPYQEWSGKQDKYVILAQQLGLELTPELLWNIAPWSWAADWFGNFGSIATNFTNFHQRGLVLLYGYIMEHTRVQDTYRMANFRINGVDTVVQDVIVTSETKQRRAATPYGFGLSFEGFSNFQKSILIALGLTKGSR